MKIGSMKHCTYHMLTVTHRVNSLNKISLSQSPLKITWTVITTNPNLITSVNSLLRDLQNRYKADKTKGFIAP